MKMNMNKSVNRYINATIWPHVWHRRVLCSVPLREGLGGQGGGPRVGRGRQGLHGGVRDVSKVSHRAPQYRGPEKFIKNIICAQRKMVIMKQASNLVLQ